MKEDYLDFVASLNDAKLIEENIQMSSSLKIIDSPFYPVNAEASKKPLIISLGTITTLILCIAIIVFLEFIDSTIRTPERLKSLSTIGLIGGFPIIGNGGLNNQITRRKLINQISNYIYLQQFEFNRTSEAFTVLFLSTKTNEGKSQIMHLIADSMRNAGHKILVFHPTESDLTKLTKKLDHQDNKFLDDATNQGNITKKILERNSNTNFSDYDYVFYELPAIIGSTTSIKLLKTANLSILVARANRIWNAADSMAVSSYKKCIDHPISAILNGAMVDNLESLIGEIPKSRSRLRIIIKRIASLRFKRSKF